MQYPETQDVTQRPHTTDFYSYAGLVQCKHQRWNCTGAPRRTWYRHSFTRSSDVDQQTWRNTRHDYVTIGNVWRRQAVSWRVRQWRGRKSYREYGDETKWGVGCNDCVRSDDVNADFISGCRLINDCIRWRPRTLRVPSHHKPSSGVQASRASYTTRTLVTLRLLSPGQAYDIQGRGWWVYG